MAQCEKKVQCFSVDEFLLDPAKTMEMIAENARQKVEDFVNTTVLQEFLQALAEARAQGMEYSKNGTYERTLKSSFGVITLRFPRLREVAFESRIVAPYQRNLDELNAKILQLYDRGLSSQEISELLASMGLSSLSRASVMKIAQGMAESADEFIARKLSGKYPVLFLDGTWLPLRRIYGGDKGERQEYDDECVLVALGIDSEGHKEVLGFRIAPAEGSSAWEEFLRDLVARGLSGVRLVVTDGLNGMPEAIAHTLPGAEQQRCCFHVSKNIAQKVGKRKRSEALADFRKVYAADTREEAGKALLAFVGKWSRPYPELRSLLDIEGPLLRFFDYPRAIRKSIYTSNAIEGFNSKLKRELAKRISMNSLNNAKISVVSVCRSYNQHGRHRIVKGFGALTDEDMKALGIV